MCKTFTQKPGRVIMESQKNAVCNAILCVLAERGVNYELNGETILKDVFNKADQEKVRMIITEGLEAEEITFSDDAKAKYIGNEAGMKPYVNGLIKNWVKKNPDFNNGEKYEPENKGSRVGQGDEQVRALRSLLKTTNDPEVQAEIQEALDARIAEIKPAQTVTINVDALPEHLRHLVK